MTAPTVRLVPLEDARADPSGAVLADAPVLLNEEVAPAHFLLRLFVPAMARAARPGQFAMISLIRDGESLTTLPRPMALYDWDGAEGSVDFLYRVVGRGTKVMSGFRPGERLVTVGPLGRGFTVRSDTRRMLLLGRGIGVCSLTGLGRAAAERDVALEVVISAREPGALIGVELFRSFGARVWTVTDQDGSSDVARLQGLLASRLEVAPAQQIAVCGSERLLLLGARLAERFRASLEVSLEARMACGIGYCHGCASGRRDPADESPLICAVG
ncbi:MAG: dihydroorotate oxidase electron transfer subunit, partial [Candidatus Limnocylindria bacterium]|nr:dihydroorotate oxidase electron transfer subunit [Candidatus Limnocylindria bacterium]